MNSRELSNKLPKQYENPVDYVFEDISYQFGPILYKMNFTPNIITTFALITGIITIHQLYNNYFITAAIFHILTYFFDCLDGNFARRYNMETKIGDIYDHTRDTLYSIAIIYILYKKNNHTRRNTVIIYSIFAVLSIMTIIQFGCTEKYIKQTRKDLLGSDTLSIFSRFCYDKPYKLFQTLRFFSSGTLIIAVTIFIISLHFTTNK